MNTKLKGDIAEQAAIMKTLQLGWGAAKPIGDRLPYDLIADVSGTLVRLQVKCAWFNSVDKCFVVDVRRTKTNRRIMLREPYTDRDFDFALVCIPDMNIFYVFPVEVFIAYGSTLTLVENETRQRKPKSSVYREAFGLISQWAVQRETFVRNLSNSGKPLEDGNPEPSPATIKEASREGVETLW